MIEEVLFVHHSHTDIGYTHPQPVVMELHRRFTDQALDLADDTADWPDGERFKWTCEVTGTTLDWWRHADTRQRERFLAAVERGQFEVAGLGWNMTPLMDHAMLLETLDAVAFFRSLGVPVRSAMNSDVNGLPWGTVDALLDHGITGLSMAINEHFGYAVQPRPRGFHWEGASGRKLTVWNGFIYGVTVDQKLRVPVDQAQAAEALPAYLKLWEGRGYPHSFLMVQATNVPWHDNAPPNPLLAPFVRQWNRDGHDVRLRIVTLSEAFDRLRQEPADRLATLRGDWTDWWNFGSGSTARETALSLEGQRALREAEQLRAWPGASLPRDATLLERTRSALALYAEHTWGADRSIWKHSSPETHIEQGLKLATALEGVSLARMLRRDGLERLARHAGGDELTALLFNPLPYPVRRTLRFPEPEPPAAGPVAVGEGRGVDNLAGDAENLRHRQDIMFGDYDAPITMPWLLNAPESGWVGPVELPAMGYATWSYDALPRPEGTLHADDDGIGNERLRVRFDREAGGIASMTLDGHEIVRSDGPWRLAQPVLERPVGGSRGDIFGPPDYSQPNVVHRLWRTDWEAERSGPRVTASHAGERAPGCAEYLQEMELPSGDRIVNRYRLFAGEATLELETLVTKAPISEPHALYLAMPLDLQPTARCHFETAGAVVELDREQLPASSSHYLTTQRFVRLQDDAYGLTVATPDAPLWQVGGFTFGRHREGVVERNEAALTAWLANNYWDTNFRADQGGELRFRFHLTPHTAQPLATSIRTALTYAVPPQLHVFKRRGPQRHRSAALFDIDLAGALLTGVDADEGATTLTLLNPDDTPLTATIGPEVLHPVRAWRADLSGARGDALPLEGGRIVVTLAPRAWTAVAIEHRSETAAPKGR